MCPVHHHARHEGIFDITFDENRATFTRADGVVLGGIDLCVLAPAGCDPLLVPAQKANVEDATKALVKLGFGKRDVARMIAEVGPCASTEALVREALRRVPVSA